MEDLETLFQNIPGKPRLELLMEDLETLVQNNPPPHAKIGTSHGGLRNFGPEYPPPPPPHKLELFILDLKTSV